MLKIFIDTEFTDFFDAHLISIGLAAASGEEFYAEVPYPTSSCSEFVRDVVVPMLGRTPHANCTKDDLRGRLLTWLSLVFGWGLAGIWSGLSMFIVLRLVFVGWRAVSGRWAVTGA